MLKVKIIIINVLFVLLIACSSGSGDAPIVATTPVPPGIYAGTVTPTGLSADTAVALLTSNNKVAIVDTITLEAFIGTISNSSITGTMFASSAVSASGEITLVAGNVIAGTYTSSLGGGIFTLVADPIIYDRGAALSKLEGTWVDAVYTSVTGTTTWVIQADGSYTMASTGLSNCAGTGNFSLIDSSKNEYAMTLTLTSCGGYDGAYTAIGSLGDASTFTDNVLTFMFDNGTFGGLFSAIKQ